MGRPAETRSAESTGTGLTRGRRSGLLLGAAALGAALGLPAALGAQPVASEPATVSQTVNGTTISVRYSRPVARGRDELFGGVVHWGEVWTPGADWATTLTVDRPVTIGGHRVEPGTYSVWIEIRRDRPWRFLLHADERRFHTEHPRVEDGLFSVEVTPVRGADHMEAMAIYFPVAEYDRAEMRVHWGDTYVAVPVDVDPWAPLPVAEDRRRAWTGEWVIPLRGRDRSVEIVERGEGLAVSFMGGRPQELLHAGDGLFYTGRRRDGRLFSVPRDAWYRFVREDGNWILEYKATFMDEPVRGVRQP